jgi:hypothetical protein
MRWAGIGPGLPGPGLLAELRQHLSGPHLSCGAMAAHIAMRARAVRIGVNVLGAASAALFARASILLHLHSDRLLGVVFFVEHARFAVAFRIRRPAWVVSNGIGVPNSGTSIRTLKGG